MVCIRPSRRKRAAAIHSNGSQLGIGRRSHPLSRPDRVAGGHDALTLGEALDDLDRAFAAQQTNIIHRVLSAQAHIVLLPPKEAARPLRDDVAEAAIIQKPFQRVRPIDQWQKITEQVAAMPAVTAVSPMASGSLLAARGEATRAVTVQGVGSVGAGGRELHGAARVRARPR